MQSLMILRITRSVSDRTDINWECGLLLPVDYPTSLELNIFIDA